MNAVTDNPPASLERLLLVQRSAFEAERYPSVATRRDRLERLRRIVTQDESRFVAAIERDFGHRSAHETRLAELYIVGAEARHAIRRLSRWMKPRRVATPWHLLPASARIMHQPVGVVGIISPWNYPFHVAIMPLIAALAWRDGGCTLASPSTSVAEIVVRTMKRASCAGHGRPRCIVARLSHMTTSPLRQVWT